MTTTADVSRETSERLAVFALLLRKWNRRINLVGRGTLDEVAERHIDDSLQLIDYLPPSGPIADLGSGAGFPGLIVGIVTGRPVTLVESDTRKAAFLHEAARMTDTNARILTCRVEDCGLTNLDAVLARALAPLKLLCRLAQPLLAPNGVGLFPKGAQIERELTDAELEWQMTVMRHPSRIAPGGCVLEVRHLKRREQPG